MVFYKLIKSFIVLVFFTLSSVGYAQSSADATVDTSTETTTPADTTPTTSIDTATTSSVATPQDDAAITNSITSEIEKRPMLSKLNVGVTTNNGVVTLKGNVDSDSQASSLVELAQSINGVRDINTDDLIVKDSKQPLTDTWITAKVKGLFIREEVFGTKDIASINISVETNNGVVYLTGTVDNDAQIKNAIKLAESVSGVKKVEYSVKKVSPTASSQ